MERVLIITEDEKSMDSLCREIVRGGYDCATVSYDGVQQVVGERPPHLIVIDGNDNFNVKKWELIISIKKQRRLPLIALVAAENLDSLDNLHGIDDFIVYPGNNTELLLRIRRLLREILEEASDELIKCDGLTIDLVTCEVTVDGIKTDLTYKEFELLKLMAGHRGRVFTREALLDKIWGYDYYGGDRTVDVHMRRLRSKIEDANHTYIETVRNIGYRFIKGTRP
jgi:two-component system alkaline phosphatase synthesis response regulator PhoP